MQIVIVVCITFCAVEFSHTELSTHMGKCIVDCCEDFKRSCTVLGLHIAG